MKCLKSTCATVFYCIWWLKFCNLYMKKAVSQRCSIKEVFWKATENSLKQSFGGVHLCWSLFLNKVAGWKPEIIRSSHCWCSVKQGVLKNFANFTGKNLCWSLFLIKVAVLRAWKKTSTQMNFANFLRTIILKNNYFVEDL